MLDVIADIFEKPSIGLVVIVVVVVQSGQMMHALLVREVFFGRGRCVVLVVGGCTIIILMAVYAIEMMILVSRLVLLFGLW